jgi:hypothetical protein
MRKIVALIAVCAGLTSAEVARTDEPVAQASAPGAPTAESPARFDGTWSAILSCAPAAGAVPYRYKLSTIIKQNILHGERGVEGTPGWLELDGRIGPDGLAYLEARGLVGRPRAAVGDLPTGTPYHYRIEATFADSTGSGHRVNVRGCTVAFSKEPAGEEQPRGLSP